MTLPSLTPDDVLATTRSVRRRLDLTRPVERHLIEECVQLAQQAPSGSNRQGWHFVVVTDPAKRLGLAELYRRAWAGYVRSPGAVQNAVYADPARQATQRRVGDSAQYLADHMHEVPALVVPCIECQRSTLTAGNQAGLFGSIIPATWSFCLAARARGLGTCWTTMHLQFEQEAAAVLGIPYDDVLQAALIPLAHTVGLDFKPAAREPVERMLHWDAW